ncbi:hypothetical protein ACEWX3_07705 [Mycobacterium sp. G7A2]|uniref:TRADD-N-associated membrane domain-containing protein n=1 Tax=Mycobacterium sp. G7A2 TaxID=3317307 RepID=UPI0035A93E5E
MNDQRKSFWRRLEDSPVPVVAGIMASLAGLAGGYLLLAKKIPPDEPRFTYMALATAIFLTLGLSMIVAFFPGGGSWELDERLRGEVDQAVHGVTGPDDLMGLMNLNRKQMEAYDSMAKKQASSAHSATLGAAIFGLITVGAGIVVAVTADAAASKFAAAIVSAVGTATGGYIAATFIRVQEGAREQMRYYFQQPLVQSYLLSAERLVGRLDEKDRPEQMRAIIAAAIAQTAELKNQNSDGGES